MMRVRASSFRLAALAVVAGVAGVLLLAPAPPAHACSVLASRTERVPVDQATDEDRRWAVPSRSGPDYLEVIQPSPLPPGGVLFEGTAVATGASPPDETGWSRTMWTHFLVERVLRGDLAPEVVVVNPGIPCVRAHATYEVDVRQRVVAVRDPATGELRGLSGRYAAPPPEPAPGRPTSMPSPTTVPTPPALAPRPGGTPAGEAGRLARTALGVFGLLVLSLLAAAACLRSRELELEERELALREREREREREAGRRVPPS